MPLYVQSPPFPRGLYPGDKAYSFGALAKVALAANPTGLVRNADGSVTATTSVAHKAVVGETATVLSLAAGAGGTRFDGNYFIKAAPSGTTLTLIPVDDVILHQAPDTGGGGTISLMQSEQPALLSAGTAIGLMQRSDAPNPTQFFASGKFDAAPGVFEVDIQVADVDVDAAYSTAAGGLVNAVDAVNFGFHVAITDRANFARHFIRARANAVNYAGTVRA